MKYNLYLHQISFLTGDGSEENRVEFKDEEEVTMFLI